MNYLSAVLLLTSDVLILVFGFIIPVSIIIFCNDKIIKILSGLMTKGANAEKTEHKAAVLVLAVLLAFLICWVPYHLVKILYVLRDAGILIGCSLLKILYFCSQIFSYFAFFNSVLNPILDVIVGKKIPDKSQRSL